MITKQQVPNYAPCEIELPNGWTASIKVVDDPDGGLSACAVDHAAMGEEPCSSQTGPWVGVVVTISDSEGDPVDATSLWGIESDTDYWRDVASELVNELAEGIVIPSYASEQQQEQRQEQEQRA